MKALCLLLVVTAVTANPLFGGDGGDGDKKAGGSFPFVVSGTDQETGKESTRIVESLADLHR